MKNLLLILLLNPIFLMASPPDLSGIKTAIMNGDAQTLGKYFDNNVELGIIDDENTYSKAQAVKKVSAFFAKHKPQSFGQTHQGTSKGNNLQYFIGDLNTSTGVFRVNIFVKVVSGKSLIQELRFDEE